MGKGLLFFCCACCILVLTIINLSIGPVITGRASYTSDPVTNQYYSWATANCKMLSDQYDTQKEAKTYSDEYLKYSYKWIVTQCKREKGMHDMEYTSFIFDIVIGFVCGLIGLLHLFDLKKDFVSNTGLIGLGCGVVGFVLTFVYVIFNGIVYTTYGPGILKRDGDGAFAERVGENRYECFYFDKVDNIRSYYATYSDLIKKQYNYDKDFLKDVDIGCKKSPSFCSSSTKDFLTGNRYVDSNNKECQYLYIQSGETEIRNKDISDRFLTTLILSLFVCLANIGLALFGFLLFRNPSDF